MLQYLLPLVDAEGVNRLVQQIGTFALFPIIIVAFYFFAIRPQQKKDKAVKKMRTDLTRGDRVTTIGGIYGRVTEINEEIVTIEVGNEKTKIMIARWAIGSIEGQEDNGEQLNK